jgi:outer membrane lipoprotein-sorting protein
MRRLLMIATLISLQALQAFGQNAPSVDEIVGKNINARGGMAKITAIKTLRATYASEEDGKPVRLVELHKRPDKLRRNISTGGNTIVFAYDGTTAWQFFSSQKKGASSAPPDLALELKEEADMDGPLVNYKEKEIALELVGKEKLNERDVYNLKMTLKEGQVRNIYLDARTFLEVKETGSFQEHGKKIGFVTLFKNYRPVQGVLFPYIVEQTTGDEEAQVTRLQKLEVNVPIADSVFTMRLGAPGKAPK